MAAAGYSVESERVATWADGRIAELMGVINAATAELVSVVGEVIEAGAWAGAGVRSPAQWVSWRAGVSAARAAQLVRMARRLGELPTVAGAFAQGQLSEDSVALVAARVPPERDAEVAALAREMTVSQLGRTLRSLPAVEVVAPEEEPKSGSGASGGGGGDGEVSFGYDDDDRWWLRAGGLGAERGALVAKALQAARDAEFHARSKQVSWSDALERMALAALEALDPGCAGACAGACAGGRAASGRFQVLVHVGAGEDPAAHLHLGPALSSAARRRITCDADLRWVLESEGRTVAWGRRTRTVPPALRAAIEDRDRGCRVPGCTQVRWLEVHHIAHVEDGGETVPSNLACLCGAHHADHHAGVLGISGDPTAPGGLRFTDRWGKDLRRPPPVPPNEPPPEAARSIGVTPGQWDAPSGETFDGRWFTWN